MCACARHPRDTDAVGRQVSQGHPKINVKGVCRVKDGNVACLWTQKSPGKRKKQKSVKTELKRGQRSIDELTAAEANQRRKNRGVVKTDETHLPRIRKPTDPDNQRRKRK